MTAAIGVLLAVLLLGLVAAGLWVTWRRPFVAIGLLVAGMAFHNFVVMWLLQLGTPHVLVRAVQGWKELILFLLAVIAVTRIAQLRQFEFRRLIPSDWIALAFAFITVAYFLLPQSVTHSGANISQRLVGFRILFLIPLLYFLGRALGAPNDRDRLAVVWLSLGAAGVVTLFGIFELFLLPTRVWLDWGINQYSAFLGFKYQGPAGLPENFFLTLSDGTLIRRMVSTYMSPLGIAYTALLLFPMAVAVMDRRVPQQTARWIAMLTTLIVIGVALSLTRLALFGLVGEAVLLFLVLRRAWILGLIPVLGIAAALALFPYTTIAPAVDQNLGLVSRGGIHWNLANDSSAREHYGYLIQDLKFDLHHPMGLGTGASTIRYGKLVGTGESAVLGVFGDLGLVGGGLYLGLYALGIFYGWKALRMTRKGSLEEVMPLIAFVGGLGLFPITMTSDVWGDLSVTLLFWWAVGATASLSTRAIRLAPREVWEKPAVRRAA
ncbi:MAG TPA: hypothetical protein VNA65_11275 [Candidatus Dormibacteraeota bacterium]|nr:hypothetical protein [Candidatus Dormibacteraeota bacterium]